VAFAEAPFAGTSLGDAAEQAVRSNPAFDFGAALAGLFTLGAFSQIAQPEGVSRHG
jgi:hypothetical protein